MTDAASSYAAAHPSNREGLPEVRLDASHSPFKVLAQGDLLRKFIDGEPIRPIHMRIGIMGACNMRCNFCNFHSPNEEQFYDLFSYKHSIATDAAIALLGEFGANGGRAVTFCGSGECTIHPGYAQICRAAKGAGLRIGLITNGSRLQVAEIARCVADTHTWIRVGMNAGTAKTFAAITHHREKTFGQLLDAIGSIRDNAADPDFRIGLNFVITRENYHEIVIAAHAARAAGAHYVRFEPEFYSTLAHETIQEMLDETVALLADAMKVSTGDFEVSVPKLDRGPMDQVEIIEGDFDRCHYSHFVTAVGADGNLYPCPQVHLNSRYRIGNVVESSYLGVLEGGPRKAWESSNPLRTDLCKSCFYRPQNELLEWLHRGQLRLEDALSAYSVEIPRTLHAEFV